MDIRKCDLRTYGGTDTRTWVGDRDAYASNKLAKARKMRKPPGMLGLKKFGPGKILRKSIFFSNFLGQHFFGVYKVFWVKKVFRSKKQNLGQKIFLGQKVFWIKKHFGSKKFSR